MGLSAEGKGAAAGTPVAIGKYNRYHDEGGRFTTADNAVEPVERTRRQSKPGPRAVQVASNDTVLSDAGEDPAGSEVSQVMEPEPPEPPPPEPPGTPRPTEAPVASASLLGIVARDGKLPGQHVPGVDGRTMPASDDPDTAALEYAKSLYDEQAATAVPSGLEENGGFVVRLPDGAYITYRPAGLAGKATLPTTTTVEINDPGGVNAVNGGKPLKLKFPKK